MTAAELKEDIQDQITNAGFRGLDTPELASILDDMVDFADERVLKVEGKQLSTEDYTTLEKNTLASAITYAPVTNQTDLQAYITANRVVNLGVGTIDITSPLTIPSNTVFRGVRGGTRFRLTSGAAIVSLTGSHSDITFDGITFDGNVVITQSTYTIADAKARNGAGTQSGIYVNGYAKNIHVKNCEFINFNLAGINLYRNYTGPYSREFKITDNNFQNCYIGLLVDVRSEYNTIMGNSFCYNKVGMYIVGGNNMGVANHCAGNGIGCVVLGTGENDSHGSMSSCTFNHSLSHAIALVDIANGFTFSACHCYDGNIGMDNCKGLNFQGGIIAVGVVITNANNVAYNMISNTLFVFGATITGDKTKLLMDNNRYMTGQSSTDLNNNV